MASYRNDKKLTEIFKKYQKKLQQFTLKNVKEIVSEEDNESLRAGAYGEVIDLEVGGAVSQTCVGKVLHSIFFDPGTDPSGMQCRLEKFFDEIETLSKMKHSNIVRFVGIFYKQDSLLPVLVMEKMECDLTKFLSIHEKGSITVDIALQILLDVSKGLFYLHEVINVAHRDLTSNNILLAADLSAKVADLGSARVLDRPGGWSSKTKLTVAPGALDFMPPEALKDSPEYTASVDVFSFGCVIIHLCTHKWPTPISLSKGVFVSEIERRKEYISEISNPYLVTLVKNCLKESSAERPNSTVLMDSLENEAMQEKPDYTVVFAGVAGAGKSRAGNFLLKQKAFQHKKRLTAVTLTCSAAISTVGGKTVKIIDTPGFFDGFKPTEENHKELSKALTFAKDGVHAVAFVMDNTRFTEQCNKAIKELLRFEDFQPYIFVLLTHADDEGVTKEETDEYIKEELSSDTCPLGLKELMQVAEKRVVMVECLNTAEDYHTQKCKEFITMIENIDRSNGFNPYTNDVLRETAQVYEDIRMEHAQQNSKQIEEEKGYFEKLTEDILNQRIKHSSITESNLKDFLKQWVKKGCYAGTIVGLGTKFGGKFGGNFGYEIGRGVISYKKRFNSCNTQ